jgi:hypothetical protein
MRLRGLLLCLCAALACAAAGGARAGLDVGVTEDAGKGVDGAAFFATLTDVGLKVNRVSMNWDPAQPTTIQGELDIAAWLPQAQVSGTRIIFAVAPLKARDVTASKSATAKFVEFVAQLARTFPTVKDYVIGNEPNQPHFWLPQFSPANAKPLSAAAYLPVLAGSYDTLKAIDPTINVIGVGLSPRGNDQPFAKNNASRSPVRFLRDLGAAYRKSRRAKPLMDELAFHPYPSRNEDTPDVGYIWPNAGLPNLDRIKQAVWDAFQGTAQPTVVESGKSFTRPLKFDLDEVGWQVEIPPELAPLYHGTELRTVVPVDEDAQAEYYTDAIDTVACDPAVRLLSFFHLTDEFDLAAWQSGLLRADGSQRPAYGAVKDTIAAGQGNCQATLTKWRHATGIVSPTVAWGSLAKPKSATKTTWSFPAGAGEGADFRAGIFKAGPKKAVLVKRLTAARPNAVRFAKGTIKAKRRVVYFPAGKLKPGKYVFAIRMTATMNPKRASAFVSRTFRVAAAKRK